MELGAVSAVIRDYRISPITLPRLGTTCVAYLHERDLAPPGFMVLRGRSAVAPEEEQAFGASTLVVHQNSHTVTQLQLATGCDSILLP